MQTKDHLLLAKYITRTASTKHHPIRFTYRAAFIIGSIEPDINMFSYFKGSLSNKPLTGHNFECSKNYMQKLLRALSLKTSWSVYDYFLFGRLTHYATDSFTYPHNNIFSGTIREHSDFENRLHQIFTRSFDVRGKKALHRLALNRLYDYIEANHAEYIKQCGTVEIDCMFIADITNTIACTIPTENVLLKRLSRQTDN